MTNLKKKFNKLKIIALTSGCGSGSKVFQSFLDDHPNIIMIPGYPLMYFYHHYFDWLKLNPNPTWNFMLICFLKNHPSVLDSRKMPGSETLNKLGKNQDQSIKVSKKKFIYFFKHYVNDKTISSKNMLLALHYAYIKSKFKSKNYNRFKIIVYHIHHPFYLKYLNNDFPNLKVISMMRDPRTNISKRVINSVQKADITKLRKSDLMLVQIRALFVILEEYIFGIKINENHSNAKYRLVKHEDLVLRLEDVMSQTAKFLEIPFNQKMLLPTFGGKIWKTTFYNFDTSSYKANPEVINDDWKKKMSNIELIYIESIFYRIIKKYYKLSIIHYLNIKYTIYSLFVTALPTNFEIKEISKLLNPLYFLLFLRITINEAVAKKLKQYNNNAFYHHKEMNKDTHLKYKRLSISIKNYRSKVTINKFIYNLLGSILYIIENIIIYALWLLLGAYYYLKRIGISYYSIYLNIFLTKKLPKYL